MVDRLARRRLRDPALRGTARKARPPRHVTEDLQGLELHRLLPYRRFFNNVPRRLSRNIIVGCGLALSREFCHERQLAPLFTKVISRRQVAAASVRKILSSEPPAVHRGSHYALHRCATFSFALESRLQPVLSS